MHVRVYYGLSTGTQFAQHSEAPVNVATSPCGRFQGEQYRLPGVEICGLLAIVNAAFSVTAFHIHTVLSETGLSRSGQCTIGC